MPTIADEVYGTCVEQFSIFSISLLHLAADCIFISTEMVPNSHTEAPENTGLCLLPDKPQSNC